MSAALFGYESPGEIPVLKAAALYDEYQSGCRTKGFFDQLSARLGGEVEFNLALWRLDVLHLPGAAATALRDFACADLIVLAMQADQGLPELALEWLDSWAKCRADHNSALVVLWGVGAGSSYPVASMRALRELSQKHDLDLFCEWSAEPSGQTACHTERLRLREQMITPTLQGIREFCHEDRTLPGSLGE